MTQLYWPFDISTVTEWPGGYADYREGIHMGTDFGVPQGTQLIATAPGTIKTYRWAKDGYGIDINTPDGLVVRNWHISQFYVNDGDEVWPGQVIGLTGGAKGTPGAGNSTGPHLHWEIRTNTNFSQTGWLDPRNLDVKTWTGEQPLPKKDERGNKMLMCHIPQGASNGVNNKYAIFGAGFFFEFEGDDAANAWIVQIGGQQSAAVNRQTMDLIKAASNA